MSKNQIIIKFSSVCEQNQYSLKRISGVINASNFIKLVHIINMDANPRKPKVGQVTSSIKESLDNNPELFQFKTKGLLISSFNCKSLDRKRYRLNFEDPDIEGILDGGHNTLAISIFLISKVISSSELRKIKTWDHLKEYWDEYSDEIDKISIDDEFLIPIEILSSKNKNKDEFTTDILDISESRNNNAELTTETKNNKAGYYDALRKHIDKEIRDDIEWKTNDGGRIKVRDVIALSLIPISLISEKLTNVKINPVQIFSSKSLCVSNYGKIFENLSKEKKGSIREINSKELNSALKLMADIPKLYDLIDLEFGSAYNKVSPGFGRINYIKQYEKGKYNPHDGKSKYLKTAPKTKFYREKGTYKNPEGYFIPIVVALKVLMQVTKEGLVEWKVNDPEKFIKNNLPKIMESYKGLMSMAQYDPAKMGKNQFSYQTAESAFKLILSE